MCIVSITEFNNNPAKYMQIAKRETVIIKGEGETFELVKKSLITEDDLAKGISADELKKRMYSRIDKLFASKG